MEFFRAIITTSDIELLLGKSKSAACRLMREYKRRLGKTMDQVLIVDEFSFCSGVPIEIIHEHFRKIGEPGPIERKDKGSGFDES